MRHLAVLLSLLFASQTSSEEVAGFATETAQACYSSLHSEGRALAPCEHALDLANDPTTRSQVASALALIYAADGALARAQEYMDQALQLDPDNPLVLINLGSLRIKERRFAEAVTAFARAQDIGALEEPVLYLNRSLALRALGRYDEAKKDYDYFLVLQSRAQRIFSRDPSLEAGRDERRFNSRTGVTVEDRAQ